MNQKFQPRDVGFHAIAATACLLTAVFSIFTPDLVIPGMFCAVAGGMNIGVIIESKRWEKRETEAQR